MLPLLFLQGFLQTFAVQFVPRNVAVKRGDCLRVPGFNIVNLRLKVFNIALEFLNHFQVLN